MLRVNCLLEDRMRFYSKNEKLHQKFIIQSLVRPSVRNTHTKRTQQAAHGETAENSDLETDVQNARGGQCSKLVTRKKCDIQSSFKMINRYDKEVNNE